MADEANPPVTVDAAKATEEITRLADASAKNAVAEVKPTEGGNSPKPTESSEESKPAAEPAAPTTDAATSSEPNAEVTKDGEEDAGAATEEAAPSTNGTPASSKKGNNKRKSIGGGVPEHKKKTPSKKKGALELHLNVQPGDFWFVAMRGFQPWPVIVCDEEMLPEALLIKRPVSAKRIDGTYREDFREGAKNAKDRRYPIMFLGTNEFAWQVNTDLQPLDIEQVKKDVESGSQGKKSKALWEAYQIAAEGHDLKWFKNMLEAHDKAIQEDLQAREAVEAKRQEKKDKAAKRKSVVAEEVDDVEMEDADEDGTASAKKAKGSKKRKKDADSDGEPEKPTKTPKMKLKVNNKPPKEASATKPKKEPKPKKAKSKSESDEEPAKVEEKPMTEAERLEKREKSVLYLRHRLQKGFLTRDQAPKESEMDNMSTYFKQLEAYTDLEAEVIKRTKVHKVLKAIIKLNSIPKEEEHQFKKRSNDLLNSWNRALAADVETPTTAEAPAEPTTNGVSHQEKEEKTDAPAESVEKPTEEKSAAPEASKAADGDGDVPMANTKDETPATKVDVPVSTDAATEAQVEATS